MATARETTKAPDDKSAGAHAFIRGVHGVRYQVKDVKQIQIDDPDGNPIELFEPAR